MVCATSKASDQPAHTRSLIRAFASRLCIIYNAREKAKIMKRYNQVPHLTQSTIWKSDKNTRKQHTEESQEVSHFTAGDYKAAWNRHDSMTKTHTKHNCITKRAHKRSTALQRSIRKLLEGLNIFDGTSLTLISGVDQDTLMFGLRKRSLTYRCIIS